MSIAAKTLAVFMLVSTAGEHAPFAQQGTPEYNESLRWYSKEMITASYATKVCKPLYPKIRSNEAYFDYWMPPFFGSKEENAKKIRPYMDETIDKMNDQIIALGQDEFCKLVIKFLRENSAARGPAILID